MTIAALESRLLLDAMTGSNAVVTTTSSSSTTTHTGISLSAWQAYFAAHPNATAEEDFAYALHGAGFSTTQIHDLFVASEQNSEYLAYGNQVPAVTPPQTSTTRPLEKVEVVREQYTVVRAARVARYDQTIQEFREYLVFEKTTKRDELHQWVNPAEYAAKTLLYKVSNQELLRYQKRCPKAPECGGWLQ